MEAQKVLYVRIPPALKRRVNKAAEEDETSLNAWMIKCLEWGLKHPGKVKRRAQGTE